VFTDFADPRRLGQNRLVRVEIHVRNVGAIDDILNSKQCANADTCEDPSRPGCLLRMTWRIPFTR
jgi:hypothetical protein